MNAEHLTVYFDPERPEPYCIDSDQPDQPDGTRTTGNMGRRFKTPQKAAKFVEEWLAGEAS